MRLPSPIDVGKLKCSNWEISIFIVELYGLDVRVNEGFYYASRDFYLPRERNSHICICQPRFHASVNHFPLNSPRGTFYTENVYSGWCFPDSHSTLISQLWSLMFVCAIDKQDAKYNWHMLIRCADQSSVGRSQYRMYGKSRVGEKHMCSEMISLSDVRTCVFTA